MRGRRVSGGDEYWGQTNTGDRRIWGADEYGEQTTKEGSRLRRAVD
jgi:hypothetical protein